MHTAYIAEVKRDLGLQMYDAHNAGQRPYRRKDLLKLYLYCYLNKIRSSRRMEAETTRNLELMWLIGKITPDYGTLSTFMKNNKEAIKRLFKEFTLIKYIELFYNPRRFYSTLGYKSPKEYKKDYYSKQKLAA